MHKLKKKMMKNYGDTKILKLCMSELSRGELKAHVTSSGIAKEDLPGRLIFKFFLKTKLRSKRKT